MTPKSPPLSTLRPALNEVPGREWSIELSVVKRLGCDWWKCGAGRRDGCARCFWFAAVCPIGVSFVVANFGRLSFTIDTDSENTFVVFVNTKPRKCLSLTFIDIRLGKVHVSRCRLDYSSYFQCFGAFNKCTI